MSEIIKVPIVLNGTEKWGALSHLTTGAIDVVAESGGIHSEKFTFKGQHRVRLYRLKKNVHFKVPLGTELNIAAVPPAAQAPRRQPPGGR